ESVHPTGSLKHRLARSLFLYALYNGWIGPDTTIVEASSGSTAGSEAYFARMLGLPFVAVMPATTSRETIELIEFYGGKCHLVADPASVVVEASWLADDLGAHFMGQFNSGGRGPLVADRATVVVTARRPADGLGGHFIDQFTYAEPAMDRCGNNNLAESIFHQTALGRHPIPTWIVVDAGTGGTSATIGRY